MRKTQTNRLQWDRFNLKSYTTSSLTDGAACSSLIFRIAVPVFILCLMIKYRGKPTIHKNAHAKNNTTGWYEIPDLYFCNPMFDESIATQRQVASIIKVKRFRFNTADANAQNVINPNVNKSANQGFIFNFYWLLKIEFFLPDWFRPWVTRSRSFCIPKASVLPCENHNPRQPASIKYKYH